MKPTKDVLAPDHTHEEWNPILEIAAREVFEVMLGCNLKPGRLQAGVEEDLDVTSMVGLAGKLCGLLSVRCTRKAGALIASKMLGVDADKASAEMQDALGEVSNMVAGNFKNKISGLNDGCMLSVPTVVIGSDYTLHSMADSPAIEVRLLFEDMPIIVSIQIND
jgi:chemotaxis protein CheX